MKATEKLYLDCVHCGLCLSSCPTYRVLGSEMDSPRGRIHLMRALDEGKIGATESFRKHMFRCLDCRACETACPAGVKFGQMMEDVRAEIVPAHPPGWPIRLALEHVFPYPLRFKAFARLLGIYQRSGLQRLIRASGALGLFPDIERAESLSPMVDRQVGPPLGSVHPTDGRRNGRVAFFSGCVMNEMMGSINRASVRLMNAAGYDVVIPGGQTCCGALANHSGLRQTAVRMATANLAVFQPDEFDAIIVNAAGCGSTLKEYGHLVEGAEPFSRKVRDISEFLAETDLKKRLTREVRARIGYDDPCHLVHGQGVRQQPRALLRAIPGAEIVEIEGADQCCGSAGIYNLTEPDLSMKILDRKMELIVKARVDVLATGNPGCIIQFRHGARRAGIQLDVVHPVELLDRALS